MRLPEPISKTGYFWLPGKKRKKLPGTLNVDQYASSRIELQGAFHKMGADPGEVEVGILGVLQDGKRVTATRCHLAATNYRFPGVHQTSYRPDRVFIGTLQGEPQLSKCKRVDFAVDGLDTWLNLPGIDADTDVVNGKTVGATVRYRIPEVPSHAIKGGLQLSIKFEWRMPVGTPLTEATITQRAFLSLTSGAPKALADFLKAVHQINTFLCFAIDEIVTLTMLRIVHTEETQKTSESPRTHTVDVLFQSLPHSDRQPRVDQHRLLVPYFEISTYLGDMISKWFGLHAELRSAINLYIGATTGRRAFVETRFLFLAQALETFHRLTSDATEMDPVLFGTIKEKLLNACPAEQQSWLKGRLEYANELSLRKRLKALIGKFAHLLGDKKAVDDFVQHVISTRNYLTHYDKKSLHSNVSGEALLRLSTRIEGLMTLLLLDKLGFSIPAIEKLNKGDSRLQHKLKGQF